MWAFRTPSNPSYLTKSSYSVNSNFGTADDLKNLSSALHDRGMYLMVDVVANHLVCSRFGSCPEANAD